jgi:hypothetical protein
MVVVEVGDAFTSCLPRKGRLVLPSLLGGMGFSLMDPHPGSLQERWLTAGEARSGVRTVSKGGKA